MNKKQLQKNVLDLEYHGEAQKINAYLILLTTGVVGFLGTFIWLRDEEMFYAGIIVTILLFVIGILLYRRSAQRMQEILREVQNLK